MVRVVELTVAVLRCVRTLPVPFATALEQQAVEQAGMAEKNRGVSENPKLRPTDGMVFRF